MGSCQWKFIAPPIPSGGRSNGIAEPQKIFGYDKDKFLLIGGKSLSGRCEYTRVQCVTTSGEIRECIPMISSRESFAAVRFGWEIFVFGGIGRNTCTLSTAEK